jgi:hypothetical protein
VRPPFRQSAGGGKNGGQGVYFNEKNDFLPSTMSQMKVSSVSDCGFKCVISVRGGHCYYLSRAPKDLATPLITAVHSSEKTTSLNKEVRFPS